MTIRTFKQCGQGIGAETVSIVAKIDGVVVFEGDIPTLDVTSSDQIDPSIILNNPIFSWEGTVDFSGTANLEIIVNGTGALIINNTISNYVATGNTAPSADVYGPFYSYTENGVTVSDPFSDPKIDGADIVRVREFDTADPLEGQWWYTVNGGSTFTATVNITAGQEPIAP